MPRAYFTSNDVSKHHNDLKSCNCQFIVSYGLRDNNQTSYK